MAIPWIIISMDHYYQLGLDYSKIFANGMENPVNSPDRPKAVTDTLIGLTAHTDRGVCTDAGAAI